jgi:hypothetical protein
MRPDQPVKSKNRLHAPKIYFFDRRPELLFCLLVMRPYVCCQQLRHILGPKSAGRFAVLPWAPPTEKVDISFLTSPPQIGQFTLTLYRITILSKW